MNLATSISTLYNNNFPLSYITGIAEAGLMETCGKSTFYFKITLLNNVPYFPFIKT